MSRPAIRLARLADDGWELVSGEARHAASPGTFRIPPRDVRERLRVGQAVKLLCHIAATTPEGRPAGGVERMWAIVAGRAGELFVGILESEPAEETTALGLGAEFLYGPEHVIDVDDPPPEYVEQKYGRRLFQRP